MIPTLLIVDDEKTTREGLRAALEDRCDTCLADDMRGAASLLGSGFHRLLNDFSEIELDRLGDP